MGALVYSPCDLGVSLTFGGFIDGAWIDRLGRDQRQEADDTKGNECVCGMHSDVLRRSFLFTWVLSVSASPGLSPRAG